MTIETLKSPNPRNRNSNFRNKIDISIRLFDEHFARHFESQWHETWRHTGRRTEPQISLETPPPPPVLNGHYGHTKRLRFMETVNTKSSEQRAKAKARWKKRKYSYCLKSLLFVRDGERIYWGYPETATLILEVVENDIVVINYP